MNKEEIIKIQIAKIEKEMRDLPYHKGTEHHHGVLKAKMAKLKDELGGASVNKSGGGGAGYAIKHSGDASVVLVGLPSVGKSTLLNSVTNAASKVGNYDFTTLGVVPGMMTYKGVNIQILDLPGIIEGAAGNKGFGRKVISVIRASDLIVIMSDVKRMEWINTVEQELYNAGIRLNTRPPKISIKKTSKGAIQVIDPYKSFDKEVTESVVKEMGHSNAIIHLGEKIDSLDKLIDGLVKTRKYMSAVKLVTKIDLANNSDLRKIPSDWTKISVNAQTGIDDFKDKVWQGLGLVRVYLKKERSGLADKVQPLIVKNTSTLDDVLKMISNNMRDDVSRAYIWGLKAKFPGQEVSFSFQVFDEMEVWFGR